MLFRRFLTFLAYPVPLHFPIAFPQAPRDDPSCGVQTEKYHQQAVDRKKEKEAAKARKDKLQRIRDIEARAEVDNSLQRDTRPAPEDLADARALREQVGRLRRLHATGGFARSNSTSNARVACLQRPVTRASEHGLIFRPEASTFASRTGRGGQRHPPVVRGRSGHARLREPVKRVAGARSVGCQ